MPKNPTPPDTAAMVEMTVTVTDSISVPEGSTIEIAPTGMTSAIKLPDGTILKPWIVYERNEDENLTYDQLVQIGCYAEQNDRLIEEG